MILSMTGYGEAEFNEQGRKLRVEIKSLNSKSFDLNFRTPLRYRALDLTARKQLTALLHRGKCEVNVFEEWAAGQDAAPINKTVVAHYIQELKAIFPLTDEALLPTVMRMPNVFASAGDNISDEEQKVFLSTLKKAAEALVNYRQQEGISLGQDLTNQLEQIKAQLKKIAAQADMRIATRKQKLHEQLRQLTLNYDQDRLEQELIYYLDKWDINEELVRLRHHLDYFQTNLVENAAIKGKKLGFIAQEMGREINTIGSKANDSDLQKSVVSMKDALERIKEQVLNAL